MGNKYARIPNIETFKNALKGTRGSPSKIAKNLDCTYHCVWEFMHNNDEAKHLADVERLKLVDIAEDALETLLQDSNPQIVMFALKTLGKNRGYQEIIKTDVNVKTLPDIKISFDKE